MAKTNTPATTTTSYSLPAYVNLGGLGSISSGKNSTAYEIPSDLLSAYQQAQKSLAENISNVNVFSPEVLSSLNEQVEAYKKLGVKNINEIYNPMLKNNLNDSAKRFGNIDNSVFLNNLGAIENKRSDAVSDLTNNIAAYKSELIANELTNRYNYLNFLNNFQNGVYGNALNALGLTYTPTTSTSSNSSSSGLNSSQISTLASALLAAYTGRMF